MAKVKDILARKGSQVICIDRTATVLEAAQRMNEHRIGSVVVSEFGHVVGIFTERDVLQRVVAEGRDPATLRVGEVMTEEVACCHPETSLEEASTAMKERRIRRLPVVDGGNKLIGMISMGDLNAMHASSQEHTIHLLHEYLYGRC